jgi:L-ectoine synthase
MIVRTLGSVIGTRRDVSDHNWRSLRLLLAEDGMGFSLHITTIQAGSSITMQYKNHVEAVYCVRGIGSIVDLATQESHPIIPGTLYALNAHDAHRLNADEELELVCVFNPPCVGTEVHDASGAYPLASPS